MSEIQNDDTKPKKEVSGFWVILVFVVFIVGVMVYGKIIMQ